jgi:hypothetical protein
MSLTKESPDQIRRRKSRECLRITGIQVRLTKHVREVLSKQGKLAEILEKAVSGGHATKMMVVRTLDKIDGVAPEFRRDKHDKEIRDLASQGHSGSQIATKLAVGKSWVYNRASLIGVRFDREMCDNDHKTMGRRVMWAGSRWCVMCLEDAHPGAYRRKILKLKADHYEEVRANTMGWLGRQLEKASTSFHRADIQAEMDKW